MSDTHDQSAGDGDGASAASASSDVTVPALQIPAALAAAPTAADVPLISPVDTPSSPLVRFGGLLGIAGVVIACLVLVIGCAGFTKALAASYASIGLGGLGLVLALAGSLAHHRRLGEDTHVLQALFACVLALASGLFELAVWEQWPILK